MTGINKSKFSHQQEMEQLKKGNEKKIYIYIYIYPVLKSIILLICSLYSLNQLNGII
jgi:hypothetical protein